MMHLDTLDLLKIKRFILFWRTYATRKNGYEHMLQNMSF